MAARLKLTLMGMVMLTSVILAISRGYPWHWLVCAALGLSWVGDALLARFPPVAGRIKDPFTAGMGAFALAQLAYILAFRSSMHGMPSLHMVTPGLPVGTQLIGAVLPVYLLVGLLFWALVMLRTEHPGFLKGMVLVYCELLCAMAAYAFAAAFTGVAFVWPLAVGGALFIVSDMLIAMHVFRGRFENEARYDFAVWATYLPAQLLLLIGAARLI